MNAAEPTAHTSRAELCSVCGDQADGYHYGVLSCRGCNAFFRRAVTYNQVFQCRRGGTCIVDRNARCACRACRLQKCKLVGMDSSAVQIPNGKNSLKWNNHSTKQTPFLNHSLCNDIGIANDYSPQDGVIPIVTQNISPNGAKYVQSPNSAFTPVNGNAYSLSVSPCNLSTELNSSPLTCPVYIFGSAPTIVTMLSTFLFPSSTNLPTNTVEYFSRLTYEYIDQRRRRRTMLCVTLEDVLNEEANTRFNFAGVDDLSAIYRIQMILMFEWVEKLPEFNDIAMNAHDKVRLLRAFSFKYLLLDNVAYTLELGHLDRVVFVNNNFVQPGVSPSSLGVSTSLDHHALSLMYGENTLKILEEIVRPMAEMNITYAELMVLRLLLLWNPGSLTYSSGVDILLQGASERALQALHSYFEIDGTIDIKCRLGTLLLFISPITKHAQHIAEVAALISNFGVLSECDSFMNDLLHD